MSITLDAHATFMANGSFRKDSHRRYEMATRICLTFMIKAVPEREREKEREEGGGGIKSSGNFSERYIQRL